MFSSRWDVWPCIHACTAFFSIDPREVRDFVPEGLTIKEEHGRAEIEVGFVHFPETHGLPETRELAWGIAVERRWGSGMAFYAMNIAADNAAYLKHTESNDRFKVHRPPVRFDNDLDKRSFDVRDDEGPICVLRHQPEGSIPIPFLFGDTEVWSGTGAALEHRSFKWKGVARVHLTAFAATTLHDHPFFGGVRVSHAEPLPKRVFASPKVTRRGAQLFSPPLPASEAP